MRPIGISAFVRCKDEEEYIIASLLSTYRVFDEIVVVLNNSKDKTRELIEDLTTDHPKIRLLEYPQYVSALGPNYLEKVRKEPSSSLASYYNWCMEQTTFSHVCKWDGDMIATPEFERVRDLFAKFQVVTFDGYDVLGEHTTDPEPRIFKYDLVRAKYEDWDLYEVLRHDYSEIHNLQQKCYLHMKLAKREWLHKPWSNPNLLAPRAFPDNGPHKARGYAPVSTARRLVSRVFRRWSAR